MALIGDLFIKLGLSSASFATDVDRATAKFKQSAGEMKQAARKESHEARAAVDLLGQQIGVQLPREVRKFIASSDAIAPSLAAAFRLSIVTGFTVAIGAAVVKAVEWIQAWRTSEEVLKKVEERVRSVAAAWDKMSMATLTATREQLRTQQRELQTRMDALGNQQDRAGRIGSPLTAPFAAGEAIAARQGINALIPQIDALRKAEDEVMVAMAKLTKEGMDKQAKAAKKLHDEMLAAAKNIKMVDFLPPSLLTLAEKSERALAVIRQMNAIPTQFPKLATELRDFGAESRAVFEATRLPVEELAATLAHLKTLLDVDAISMDTFQRATAQAKEQSGLLAGALQESSKGLARNLAFVSQTGLTSIGDALLGLSSWRQVFQQISTDLARMIFQLLVVRPLMNAIFGSFFGSTKFNVAPSGGGFNVTSLASGGVPAFAGGGNFGPRQMITVGERGPELLFTGNQSGTVLSNAASRGLGGGVTQHITIDNRGADFGTMAKTAALIARLVNERTLERMADRASRTV